MDTSIQEKVKYINRALGNFFLLSLGITALILCLGVYGIWYIQDRRALPVTITTTESPLDSPETRPFGSRKGTTYTYSWCAGSSAILDKNKVYYPDEARAQASGRTLSKLCK